MSALVIRSISPACMRSASVVWLATTIVSLSRYGRAMPGGVLPPVVRVAREDEPLPRHVLGEHERAQAGDLGERGLGRPRVLKRVRRRAPVSSLWRGRIGMPSISRRPGANGAGRRRTTVAGSGASTCKGFPPISVSRGERRLHLRIVERAERKQDVG